MKKYNHEKILYFAAQDGGFNTNKHSPRDLKKMVNELVSQKLLNISLSEDGFTVYRTTPSGKKKLLEYQAAYQRKKQAPLPAEPNLDDAHIDNSAPQNNNHTNITLDEKLTNLRRIFDMQSNEGVACLDINIPVERALLDAKLFDTLGIDDAGVYVKLKSDIHSSFSHYLVSGDVDKQLISALEMTRKSLHIETPDSLSEYREVAYHHLQEMVNTGRLTQAAVNGINELHFDVCFDEGRDLNIVLHELMENAHRHEFNSPEHLEQLRGTLFEAAKQHLSQFSERDPYHIEQFCATAKKITGRDFSQANADHLFKEVKRDSIIDTLLNAAESIKKAHPDLEHKILVEALRESTQKSVQHPLSEQDLSLALTGELTSLSLSTGQATSLSTTQAEEARQVIKQATILKVSQNESQSTLKMR